MIDLPLHIDLTTVVDLTSVVNTVPDPSPPTLHDPRYKNRYNRKSKGGETDLLIRAARALADAEWVGEVDSLMEGLEALTRIRQEHLALDIMRTQKLPTRKGRVRG